MEKEKNSRKFDLDERTFKFAYDVIGFVKKLPRTIANNENVKQLVRSAGSIGANYIEASEALSQKDFTMHIKICRKEAKESRYWLQLLDMGNSDISDQRDSLIQEVTELMKIFGAIIEKSK